MLSYVKLIVTTTTVIRRSSRFYCNLVIKSDKKNEDSKSLLDEILSRVQLADQTRKIYSTFEKDQSAISTVSSTKSEDLKRVVMDISQMVFADIGTRDRTKLFKDIDSEKHNLVKFIDLLRNEMVARLKIAKVDEDKYISLNNENFQEVLEFSKSWIPLEERKHKNSFLFWVVNNIGDSSTGTSMARFKHFSKESFVNFCIIAKHVSLLKDFHTFYVLIKFLDLFDQMNQRDIADVCSTIYFHDMHLPQDHPINIEIKTKLLNFVIDNFPNIESRTLEKVCTVLNPSVEHQFPLQLIPKVKQLQRMVAEDEQRFDSRALLFLQNVTNNCNVISGDGVNKQLIDTIVERLLRSPNDIEKLQSKDMASLSLAISKHRNTPNARHLLLTMSPKMMQMIEDNPTGNIRNVIFATLQMAHLRLYVPELLVKIFSCDKVSRIEEDGAVGLARELRYKGGGGYNTNPGHAKMTGDLMMLQGMLELEVPSYRGRKIAHSDLERKWNVMRGYRPLEVRSNQDNSDFGKYLKGLKSTFMTRKTLITFSGYFVNINLDIYDRLCSIFGSECIWETYPLPFSTQVCYVVGLDSGGRPAVISETTRQQDQFSVKTLDQQQGVTWFALITHHSCHHNRVWIKTGGQPVMTRLLDIIGITAVYIDTEGWDQMTSDSDKDNYLRTCLQLN